MSNSHVIHEIKKMKIYPDGKSRITKDNESKLPHTVLLCMYQSKATILRPSFFWNFILYFFTPAVFSFIFFLFFKMGDFCFVLFGFCVFVFTYALFLCLFWQISCFFSIIIYQVKGTKIIDLKITGPETAKSISKGKEGCD